MHQWVFFHSFFDGWRWEERDEYRRIVRESGCGFDNADDALADLRLVLCEQHREERRKIG
jgi:hypothetical protein